LTGVILIDSDVLIWLTRGHRNRTGVRAAHGQDLDISPECSYSNYIHCLMRLASMEKTSRTIELKVVPIGNSRGVRLPKAVLDKYAIKDDLVLEERTEGLLLRNKRDKRLSWEDTFREMAKEREDWSDLDATMADGLDQESKW